MKLQRLESNRYEASHVSPHSDGILRVGYVGYGDTPIEAINSVFTKLGLIKSSAFPTSEERGYDDMDEGEDNSNSSFFGKEFIRTNE